MKKHLFILIALAAVIAIGATAYYLIKETDIIDNIRPAATDNRVRVNVLTVEGSNAASARTYIGKAVASKETIVKASFPSDVVAIMCKKGGSVTEGDVIVRLYSETLNSSLEMSRATMQQAQDGYDRLMKIKDNGSVPEVKIVEVETQLTQAKASVKAAEKAVADCDVKAPFSGVVSEIFVEKGESAGISAPLVKIIDSRHPDITIDVPENEIADIKIGDTAILEVPALKIKDIAVIVKEKSVDAKAVSHSYQCTLTPVGNVKNLMPGMVGKVVIEKNHNNDEIVIPASAVRTDKDGRYVWTIDVNNIVSKTYVIIDGFSGKGVVVSSGLESGDRVITEGMSKVSTGMVVEVVEQ